MVDRTPIIRIDREHTMALLAGDSVTIKVPAGVETISLRLNMPTSKGSGVMDGLAKFADVFFNGRRA
jgi:hypothetical protein